MSEPQALKTLQSAQLKDAAYEAIREAITDLRLPPGSPISENWLVSQLGISKTPIRHALTRLEQEGLVETIPFKGTFAAGTNDADAADLMQLRIVLEAEAARRVAERASAGDLQGLRVLAEQGKASEVAGDHSEALSSIADFHTGLVTLAENAWLARSYDALGGPMARLRSISGSVGSSVEDSAAEHLAIVDALQARDGEKAATLLTQHIQRVLDLYQQNSE